MDLRPSRWAYARYTSVGQMFYIPDLNRAVIPVLPSSQFEGFEVTGIEVLAKGKHTFGTDAMVFLENEITGTRDYLAATLTPTEEMPAFKLHMRSVRMFTGDLMTNGWSLVFEDNEGGDDGLAIQTEVFVYGRKRVRAWFEPNLLERRDVIQGNGLGMLKANAASMTRKAHRTGF